MLAFTTFIISFSNFQKKNRIFLNCQLLLDSSLLFYYSLIFSIFFKLILS
ncbi:hypothetical protein HMPREF6123_1290 [Oribacterium sinus F0268]|uniref:Uncharacterized protein n=1 Tax=Oribacterium sinus F0268 TaxID=585501 RepID=C2KXS1_9FIRM|nr:hypothetical protein HMPREF6123_1290 [Oribacterium sinus F0268]